MSGGSGMVVPDTSFAVLSVAEGDRIAEQMLARIPVPLSREPRPGSETERWTADREHVARYLAELHDAHAGLADHDWQDEQWCDRCRDTGPCDDATRYTRAAERASAGLRDLERMYP